MPSVGFSLLLGLDENLGKAVSFFACQSSYSDSVFSSVSLHDASTRADIMSRNRYFKFFKFIYVYLIFPWFV